ncbi:MAG: YicC/YloC family endoribonuclease, partial [Pseudomonadota bacterium]
MSKLQSMTGFSSATNTANNRRMACEMRSVNGKNLDIRLRLPNGFEPLEAEIKKCISAKIARGNLQVSVSVEDDGQVPSIAINEDAFSSIARQATALARENGVASPTADGILAVRGVVTTDDVA